MKNDSAVNVDACEMKYSVAISQLIDLKLFHNPQKDKNKQTKNKKNKLHDLLQQHAGHV